MTLLGHKWDASGYTRCSLCNVYRNMDGSNDEGLCGGAIRQSRVNAEYWEAERERVSSDAHREAVAKVEAAEKKRGL